MKTMKTKYAIAASLLISISAFAQKDELKALKKLNDKQMQITPEEIQQAKALLSQAEPTIAGANLGMFVLSSQKTLPPIAR